MAELQTNETPDIAPELAELRKPPKAFTIPAAPELTGLSTGIGSGMPGVPEDFVTARARFKTPADVSTEQASMLQRQGKLEQDIGVAQQAVKQYEAESRADIATQEREAAQRVEQNLDVVREKFPYKEFHPTKDNIESISTLFGLIGVIGAALGGSGKMSAVTSLNAMGGMMKGWQLGRADLWKKEKDEFDKGMLRVKAILEDAYKDADRAMKTLAYNRSEAEALAAQSAAKLGGQVGKQILAKQGIEPYVKYLTSVKQDLTEAEKRASEEKKFKAEQSFRDRQLALKERQTQAMEAKGQQGGFLKAGAKIAEGYTADIVLKNDLQGLIQDLQNPKLNQLLKQYRVEAFLTEEGKVLNQLLSSEIPPELLQFLTKVRDIRNNYYLNISGKAVTGGEALRSYGAVPQPGDDAQGMLNKIGGMEKRINDSIQVKRQLYRLPEINIKQGAQTNLVPGQDYLKEDAQTQRRSFASLQEAEAANLPAGTKITINGRNATVE
jgi:hypothetical protein